MLTHQNSGLGRLSMARFDYSNFLTNLSELISTSKIGRSICLIDLSNVLKYLFNIGSCNTFLITEVINLA